MDLEDVLRQIKADSRDSCLFVARLAHGRLSTDGGLTTSNLARSMPSGRRPPHQN
jgi:transposase